MSLFAWISSALVRWIRLKVYQYEVTFAIYMLTPTEKLVFNSILLSLLLMIVMAAYVYLPDHVRAIYSHLYYYWVGERPFVPPMASINLLLRSSDTQSLGAIYETAKAAAATATVQAPEL